jgi:adenylate cyclase
MTLESDESDRDAIDLEPSLQAFFNLSPDLLSVRCQDGYFQQLNGTWTAALGWTLAELRSRPWSSFVHPDDLAIADEMDIQCHFAVGIVELKLRFRTADGSYRWLQWRLSPYVNGVSSAIAQDVTASTWQGNEAYRSGVQEAVRLRDRALAASSVGMVIADARLPDMPLIYVNPAFERMTGYSAAEVLGYNCRFLQGEKTDRQAVNRLRSAIKAGRNLTLKLLNYHKNGTPFWNELTISPIFDLDNQLTHYVGIQSDITKRIRAETALRLERAKSERLLLNILPRSIAVQLKQEPTAIAEHFEEVSILFADIVGFTPLSERMSAIELVKLLNHIFSDFDRLTEKYGLEKIKTIGDAYMVAGGLPIAKTDHAEAIAAMALEMQVAIGQLQQSHGTSLSIRIGINTGSVVAGVIGLKKFIYDLWGDAVNVASRMESSGEAGKIQVTAVTYDRLKTQYDFERRGKIAVKGKGEMITYWLIGKKVNEC